MRKKKKNGKEKFEKHVSLLRNCCTSLRCDILFKHEIDISSRLSTITFINTFINNDIYILFYIYYIYIK